MRLYKIRSLAKQKWQKLLVKTHVGGKRLQHAMEVTGLRISKPCVSNAKNLEKTLEHLERILIGDVNLV